MPDPRQDRKEFTVTRNSRRHRWLAAAGLAILLIVVLSACGSSSGGGAKANAGASQPAVVVKALGNLTTCLSTQGVKVPTPVTRRGVRTTIRDLPSARQSKVIASCQTQIDALLALRPAR
jgi:hypothetical protein